MTTKSIKRNLIIAWAIMFIGAGFVKCSAQSYIPASNWNKWQYAADTNNVTLNQYLSALTYGKESSFTLTPTAISNYVDSANKYFVTLDQYLLAQIYSNEGGGSSGTVTSFSFTNGNGFVGSVTNATTVPTLSLSNTTLVPYTGSSSAVDLNTQTLANTSLLTVGATTNTNSIVYVSSSIPTYTTGYITGKDVGVQIARTTDSTKDVVTYGFIDNTINHRHTGTLSQYVSFYNNSFGYSSTSLPTSVGFKNSPTFSFSGTMGSYDDFLAAPIITTGTMTIRYGLQVNDNTTSGHIATQYGCYISTLANATTNWAVYVNGTTPSYFGGAIKFGLNSTGTGSALLGANCPAITTTAPYTWIQCTANDGSTIYVPGFK